MLDRFNSNKKIAEKEKVMFDCKQIFHPTFSGSSNKIFMLNWFTLCFIEHFILVTSLRMLKLRISNDSTKLKRSAKENHNNTKSYTCTPQIKMTFNSNREILTIYLNYNNMVKNTKMQQKLKIAEKETASRPKKVYKGNRKKNKR